MTEKDLRGAEGAVTELFKAYADAIYRLGLSTCLDREHAEDLVQETFLRAFRSWPSFEGRSKARTWLYTIAIRACRRLERRRAGQPKRMDPFDEVGAEGTPPVWSREPSPLEATERNELLAWVRRGLVALPDHHRVPLLLKDLEGLSVGEVAVILGLKEATVKTRLHRGRVALASYLLDHPDRRAPHSPAAEVGAQACLDLLEARLEAGDRGAPFPIPPDVVCDRCRDTLAALDHLEGACRVLAQETLGPAESAALLESIRALAEKSRDRE